MRLLKVSTFCLGLMTDKVCRHSIFRLTSVKNEDPEQQKVYYFAMIRHKLISFPSDTHQE